jgi:hypothetical protein
MQQNHTQGNKYDKKTTTTNRNVHCWLPASFYNRNLRVFLRAHASANPLRIFRDDSPASSLTRDRRLSMQVRLGGHPAGVSVDPLSCRECYVLPTQTPLAPQSRGQPHRLRIFIAGLDAPSPHSLLTEKQLRGRFLVSDHERPRVFSNPAEHRGPTIRLNRRACEFAACRSWSVLGCAARNLPPLFRRQLPYFPTPSLHTSRRCIRFGGPQ